MSFTQEQVSALSAKLNGKHVRTRIEGGKELSYLEGWHVIAEANRIFGFAGWDRETLEARCVWDGVYQRQRKCSYTARVRVRVRVEGAEIIREGSGAGSGMGPTQAEAHEAALKTAETDAMKRALATFGNAFGLALYDKEQNGVRHAPKRTSGPVAQFIMRSTTGEPIAVHTDPKAFCSSLRSHIERATTADALMALWEANHDTIASLRRSHPRLLSERGFHYASILESLAQSRLEEIENDSPSTANAPDTTVKGGVVVALDRPRRIRDRDHLRYVAQQPCLICGRHPCHSHHLRFAQPRAMSRKVSDEWVVPLCATHHRALHDAGDEEQWWQRHNIDPLPYAENLWKESRHKSGAQSGPASVRIEVTPHGYVDHKATTEETPS